MSDLGLPEVEPGTISVIVLNHNGAGITDLVARSARAILAQEIDGVVELIMVDDNSSDGSDAQLSALCKQLGATYCSTRDGNHGVSAARNAALRHAHGELIAFLDNDAIPEPGWLAALAQGIEADPKVGCVASRVMFDDKPDVICSLGSMLNELCHGTGVCIHQLWPYARVPERIMYATGNGMMLRRQALDEVGLFDEGFLFYGEDDADWGMRLRKAGWEIAPVVDACVLHLHSYSWTDARMNFWDNRNRIRQALKHMHWREVFWLLVQDWRVYANPERTWDYVRSWWSVIAERQGWRDLVAYRRAHRGEPSMREGFSDFYAAENRYLATPDNRPYGQETGPLETLQMGVDDERHLYHGWFWPGDWAGKPFRWATCNASLVFGLENGAQRAILELINRPETPDPSEIGLHWQRLEDGVYHTAHESKVSLPGPTGPTPPTYEVELDLTPGSYRLVLFSDAVTLLGDPLYPQAIGFGLGRLEIQ